MSTFDPGAFDAAFDGGSAFDLIFDPTAVAPTAALAPLDHVAAGLARLPQQWRDKIHMINMLKVFLKRYNDLEVAYQDLLLLRSIDTANANDPFGSVGAQLDQIGAKVGQQRNGLNNTDYRRYIRARIATNNSDGLIEDLITIGVLIVDEDAARIIVSTQAIATAVVEVTGVSIDDNLAEILASFLRLAVKGGVRFLQITHPTDDAHTFTLGDAASPSSDALTGLGNSTESGQPSLVRYTSPGVTGGQISDVRS